LYEYNDWERKYLENRPICFFDFTSVQKFYRARTV
jgi:hypothetical protein